MKGSVVNYSIFLGPDKRFVPDEKWDEYRAAGSMELYDLVFKRHPQGDHWYIPTLVGRTESFTLGQVFRDSRRGVAWACIPNPDYVDKTIVGIYQVAVRMHSQRGFATRLDAAAYLMRRQGFTDPFEW